jgi:TonB-dependent receptor
MSNRILLCFLAIFLVCPLIFTTPAFAANGIINGVVRDSQTGEPLPGANVTLVNTGFGAATDFNGKYSIRDVPPGSYTIRATYVGYTEKQASLEVQDGQTLKQDFKLLAVGVEGEEVVVTAQAAGQKAAINQQLTAMPIMNIVSGARIRELPDANAAESVSRLPGVSLIRTGGEGSQVVIRGLSPQYNQVTIDGVELPSNVTSSNVINGGGAGGLELTGNSLGDRGEDLSMISSSMLDGIEVTKAITPDMDATLIGGVVNFGLRKAQHTQLASEGTGGTLVPNVEVRTQGGYSRLKESYDNYKMVASVEKRFLDDQSFGVFVQGSDEKRNLGSNNLGVVYTLVDKTHGDAPLPRISSENVNDAFRKRQRYGGTVVLDFQHEHGEIDLMNFMSSQTTQEIIRGETISPVNDDMSYYANENNNKLSVISNLLAVKHDFSFVHADLKISHSYTESNNPEDLSFDFYQNSAILDYGNLGDLTKLDPKTLNSKVNHDQTRAGNLNLSTSSTLSKERTIQSSLDLTKTVALSSELTSRWKIGGVFQHRTRDFDYNTSSGSQGYSGGGNIIAAWTAAYPWLILSGGRLGLQNFTSDSYQYGEFLNGDYKLGYPINVNLMWALLPIAKRTASLEGYRVNVLGTSINDYNGWENKSAGYAMVVLDYGPTISVIPGVRYQDLTTRYSAMRGLLVPGGLQGGDTTIQHSHGYWLPMVHARYRPLEWLQFHFAYTNTLNYPDYSSLTPRYLISTGYIDYNNHSLKPATSENLDLVVSFMSNEIGLLSVNGFKKTIKDLVFFTHTYTSDLSKFPELPQGGSQIYTFNTYINNPNPVDLWGIETEWQTHFWYLPKPFDGLVMNLNYTHIFSEAKYPKSEKQVTYDDEGNAVIAVSDTFYTTRMLNQPNDVVNLALGYDLGGFSLRVSLLYQDNIFKNPDFFFQQRTYSAKFTRWDLSVKQNLPWFGMQVYFNVNNLNGEDDIDLNAKNLYPAYEQRYGTSMDLGLVVHL